MASEKYLTTPLSDQDIKDLKIGDMVYLSGEIYTARDAAHLRLVEMIKNNQPMPFDFKGQVVFYAGPCPNKPGYVIGSVGPTTGGRMDAYSPTLIEHGLKAMIGKGLRDQGVKDALIKNQGVYFVAVGGAAALMSQCVKSVEIIAFEDLGTEAIRKMTVEKMPIIVAIDPTGADIYQQDK